MNQRVLRHLLWKDARSVRPLVVAAVLAIVGFNGLLFVYAKSTVRVFPEQLSIAYMIWMLVPNLFAFSLPAFLIGGEEESGSLAWLKTLPASWKDIVLSKFLLAVGYTVLVWLLSSVALWAYYAVVPENVLKMASRVEGLPDYWHVHYLGQAGFTTVLLLVSLITAYLFRSPITALILVLPSLVLLLIGFGQALAVMIGSAQPPLESSEWFTVIVIYFSVCRTPTDQTPRFSASTGCAGIESPSPTHPVGRHRQCVPASPCDDLGCRTLLATDSGTRAALATASPNSVALTGADSRRVLRCLSGSRLSVHCHRRLPDSEHQLGDHGFDRDPVLRLLWRQCTRPITVLRGQRFSSHVDLVDASGATASLRFGGIGDAIVHAVANVLADHRDRVFDRGRCRWLRGVSICFAMGDASSPRLLCRPGGAWHYGIGVCDSV